MKFTYLDYINMIDKLKENNYIFSDYQNFYNNQKVVILRHDIDFTIDKALEMAKLEYNNGVSSSYFVLLCTDFYNVFSKISRKMLLEIKSLGHNIGLHFDETKYEINSNKELFKQKVISEINDLQSALNIEINLVSMHRPSKWLLDENIILGGRVINTYSNRFFKEFKYVSDSRMNWRENILDIIQSNNYDKINILTHPIWYQQKQMSSKDILIEFISNQRCKMYNYLNDNLTNLNEIIKLQDII